MKCHVCESEGQRSKVYELSSSRTVLCHAPYYDEAGVFHDHKPDCHITHYRCSAGHEFKIRWIQQCANCGWRQPDDCQIGACHGAISVIGNYEENPWHRKSKRI